VEGTLLEVREDRVLLSSGDITYEALVPTCDISSYAPNIGARLTLHTMYYFEGTLGGGNMIPRLIGFRRESDRLFFEKFTTVKGIGIRKGLRALSLPVEQIAGFIEHGDVSALIKLPEIGKRLAQQIVAELSGKLGDFAVVASATEQRTMPGFQKEAMEILIQLGERKDEIEDRINRAMRIAPETDTATKLVQLVYRLKSGLAT
jgi:Holliday junction DNA helicase RuvA